tara:strand:+ start:8764 stop:9042 length:279 start_codon:yes stop_codon:yes gene_type:complete
MKITDKQLEALEKANKKKRTSVYQFDYNTGKFIAEYDSLREAERVTGVRNNNICLVCKGEKKQAGGFRWIAKELYYGGNSECNLYKRVNYDS